MDGQIIGLVAVIMILGFQSRECTPITGYADCAARSAWRRWHVDLAFPWSPSFRRRPVPRRAGILLVSASIGYTVAFGLIARVEPDAWVAAAFGVIPFAVGLGFFLDSTLVRRDLRAS